MSSSDAALIVNARVEYVEQLSDLVGPYLLDVFGRLWKEARGSYRRFQTGLKEIPRWNSTTFEEHAKAVEARGPYLDKLIAAVLIASVKLLSSVKMSSSTEQIHLKLPTNEAFVNKVFVKAAHLFYDTPTLIEAGPEQKLNAVQLAIEKAVRDMLPLSDLLQSYIGSDGQANTKPESEKAESEAAEESEEEDEEKPEDEEEEAADAEPPADETKQVSVGADTDDHFDAPQQAAAISAPLPATTDQPLYQSQPQQQQQPQPQQPAFPQPQQHPQQQQQPQHPQQQQQLRHDAGDIDW